MTLDSKQRRMVGDDSESEESRADPEALLPGYVGQIVALEDEMGAIKDKIADLWASAKDAGLDRKAMKAVIQEVRDPEKLEAHIAGEMLVDRYRQILKLVGDNVDPVSAKLEVVAAGLRARGLKVHVGARE